MIVRFTACSIRRASPYLRCFCRNIRKYLCPGLSIFGRRQIRVQLNQGLVLRYRGLQRQLANF